MLELIAKSRPNFDNFLVYGAIVKFTADFANTYNRGNPIGVVLRHKGKLVQQGEGTLHFYIKDEDIEKVLTPSAERYANHCDYLRHEMVVIHGEKVTELMMNDLIADKLKPPKF